MRERERHRQLMTMGVLRKALLEKAHADMIAAAELEAVAVRVCGAAKLETRSAESAWTECLTATNLDPDRAGRLARELISKVDRERGADTDQRDRRERLEASEHEWRQCDALRRSNSGLTADARRRLVRKVDERRHDQVADRASYRAWSR